MYWTLKMDKESFQGDEVLMLKYEEIVTDLRKSYLDGICLCFGGKHGVGKTLTVTNILKRAVEGSYTAQYTTLSDIVHSITSKDSVDKEISWKELLLVDFLVIDEFDPRYMGSDNAAELYGRTLENIFRSRAQNKLPTLMCTNAIDVTSGFSGALKASITSLMNYVTMVSVMGKDYREIAKKQKKEA